MKQAMDLGADVVGGIPWIEFTEKDEQTHTRRNDEAGVGYDRTSPCWVDDAGDATLKTTRNARRPQRSRKAASAAPGAPRARDVPVSHALLQEDRRPAAPGRNGGRRERSATGPLHAPACRSCSTEGNLVCLGQDDISDAYYPYGQNNMLEVAFLASHLLWMTTYPEMETLYEPDHTSIGQVHHLPKFELKEKATPQPRRARRQSVCEAFRYHKAPLHVISHGKLLKPADLRG